ncbi:GntR family transcriptional regulator [Scrofimicrobium sp. R131]|uniref:GntR family transcriptional regulator n=1 Tax=Scrofimicrobium appendicitidis TaxID=3079930 RepID=A0AAU7V937_9ACTO
MSNEVPRYSQIVNVLTAEIKGGKYPLGAKIPSETVLMRRFSCSRNTVRAAIARLNEVGLINTRRGSGSYVTKQAGIIHSLSSLRSISQVIRDLGFEPGMKLVNLQEDPNPRPDIQAFLGTGHIWWLRRVTTASGTPFSINDSWFQGEVAEKMDIQALVRGGSLYAHIGRVVGREVTEATDYIGAELANDIEANLLQIGAGQPLLAIQRYAYDSAHRPVEVARSAARADMYRYYVKLTKP